MTAVVAAIAIAIGLAGCGDDESDTTSSAAPPAEETTVSDPADQPGAPATGEPGYTGLGTWWAKQPDRFRLETAEEFIADFPDECGGVKAADLERQTGIAYGYDFPEATPVDAVMIETCALINDGV